MRGPGQPRSAVSEVRELTLTANSRPSRAAAIGGDSSRQLLFTEQALRKPRWQQKVERARCATPNQSPIFRAKMVDLTSERMGLRRRVCSREMDPH